MKKRLLNVILSIITITALTAPVYADETVSENAYESNIITKEKHLLIEPEITFTLEEVRSPNASRGIINATDFKGNQLWNITTDTYNMVQAGSLVSGIGTCNGMYYCNINGITTFDLETGDVVWVNEDLTQVSSFAFMDNGNLCAKGAFGTSVYVISPEGATLNKWDLSAYVAYVWLSPVIEGVENGKLRVNMTWGTGDDTYVYLDTDTGAVTYTA